MLTFLSWLALFYWGALVLLALVSGVAGYLTARWLRGWSERRRVNRLAK